MPVYKWKRLSGRVCALCSVAILMVAPWSVGAEEAGAEATEAAPAEAAPVTAETPAAETGETAPAAPEPEPRPAERMPLAAQSLLLDVVRTDQGYVAVGDRGHILLSADAKTWTQVDAPVRVPLTAVTFPSTAVGYAVGHDAAIVKSTDGGKSWQRQYWAPSLEKPLLDVLFLDDQRGFAVGAYGLMLSTTDGGVSWVTVSNEVTAEEWHFNAITRLADGSLLVVGETGGIARSADEGATWQRLQGSYDGSFFGSLPLGEKGALIFGLRGHIYAVDDVSALTAETFREIKVDTLQSFLGGARLADGRYLLVGVNGVIALGDGVSFTILSNPNGMALSSVTPASGGVLAVGERGTQLLNP